MTITRKPRKPRTVKAEALPEPEIQALIQRGGSAASENRAEEASQPGLQYLQLRIDRQFLQRIDALIAKRPLKMSRHTWLLEAIYKQLKRDEREVQSDRIRLR